MISAAMTSSWLRKELADEDAEIEGKTAGSEGKVAAFGGKPTDLEGKLTAGIALNPRRRNGLPGELEGT